MTLFDTGLIQSALEKKVPIITSNVSKAVLSFFARLQNSGDYRPPGPSCSKGGSSIRWIPQLVFLILIRWIMIYPVDRAIQLLNNRGQENPGSKYPCINPGKTWQRPVFWAQPGESRIRAYQAATELQLKTSRQQENPEWPTHEPLTAKNARPTAVSFMP